MEIAIIFFAIIWFFVKLWENFNNEGVGKHVRVFFMMMAFIHVIGGGFLIFKYSVTENLADLSVILRVILQVDILLLIITFMILLIGWTDKGKKSFISVLRKVKSIT